MWADRKEISKAYNFVTRIHLFHDELMESPLKRSKFGQNYSTSNHMVFQVFLMHHVGLIRGGEVAL